MSDELLAAATPRPWRADGNDLYGTLDGDEYDLIDWGDFKIKADAELAARAVNEYESLLDVVTAARAWSVAIFSGTDLDEWETFREALEHFDAIRARF